MKMRFSPRPLLGFALLCCCVAASAIVAAADTIRLKDGTVVRGQIIGFRDQQFTVLLGNSERGRRSRMMIYMEDVESIEFDAASGIAPETTSGNNNSGGSGGATTPAARQPEPPPQQSTQPSTTAANNTTPRSTAGGASVPERVTGGTNASPFFQVTVRVRADSTTNGWTNSGLVLRRGQRLRIIASGRVSLGQGRFTTPAGIATLNDNGKLMANEPTGSLIAVVGDDNDDFVHVGGRREFVAQRDGVLFLGVNESELGDNTGNFDVTIEAETVSRAGR